MILSITASQAHHLSRLAKADGQRLIARHLQLGHVDLDDDLRAAALVDYYYDTLQFSVKRGLPWGEVAVSLKFANSFFQHLLEGSMPQAVRALHTLAVSYVEAGHLRLDSAKKLTSYFVSSVLSHFKLYQFVFNQEQDDDTSRMELKVETPVNEMTLKDAQPLAHWKYQQHLHTAEQDEKVLNENISTKEKELSEVENAMEKSIDRKLQDKEYENIDLEFLKAEEFISSLTADKIDIVQKSIEIEMEKMRNKAQNAMNIKAIPVPKDLAETNARSKEGRPKSSKSPRTPRSPKSRPTSTASKKKRT